MFKRTTKYPQFEAPFSKSERRARLLYSTIKYNGLADTALLLAGKLLGKVGFSTKNQRKFGEGLDHVKGLDFSGIIEIEQLSVRDGRDANRYEGTPDLEFRDVLDGLGLDYARYDFVDYGSGKGAAIAMAARYPFRSVTGVEFSADLHDVAKANLAKLRAADRVSARRVDLICQDAAKYVPDTTPHVFYFYNPFQADTTRAVLKNCCAAVRNANAPSYALLKNPVQASVFEEYTALQKQSEPYGGSWFVYRITPDQAPA